jgi:hypothetical protein
MTAWSEFERAVRSRAGDRCEYCRMHQSLQGATFHVEHIVPRSKGGSSALDNLALACPSCNLHKSNVTAAVDPTTGASEPLFHPRGSVWSDHFACDDFRIEALTPIGRATIAALDLNSLRRMRIREAEKMLDLFPPDDAV